MFEAHSINAEHKDLIHDVAYDFYGQRMATCSSDQFVKVKMGFVYQKTAIVDPLAHSFCYGNTKMLLVA
jgi:hypothetical protein